MFLYNHRGEMYILILYPKAESSLDKLAMLVWMEKGIKIYLENMIFIILRGNFIERSFATIFQTFYIQWMRLTYMHLDIVAVANFKRNNEIKKTFSFLRSFSTTIEELQERKKKLVECWSSRNPWNYCSIFLWMLYSLPHVQLLNQYSSSQLYLTYV